MINIALWYGRPEFGEPGGWFWDDAEDHGGFDRVSPQGPFASMERAQDDAIARFPGTRCNFVDGPPEHYPTKQEVSI